MASSDLINEWLTKSGSKSSWNKKKTVYKSDIFSTPDHLIFNDDLKSTFTEKFKSLKDDQEVKVVDASVLSNSSGITCRTCGLVFPSSSEQREHFKSDIHVINLKRKLKNQPPLSDESLSDKRNIEEEKEDHTNNESDNEHGDSDNDKDDVDNIGDDDDDENIRKYQQDKQMKWVLNNQTTYKKLYSNKIGHQIIIQNEKLSQWEIVMNISSLYTQQLKDRKPDIIDYLYTMSQLCQDKNNQIWSIFILKSGRFAGTIFHGQKPILHRVFRRYTIRAKAGGSQSSYDNQGGKAQSMGAQLRRYGEQMLQEDIQTLLVEWTDYLQSCTKILISISKAMYPVIFDYQNLTKGQTPPLMRTDDRICYIPFMVNKPTFEETKKIFDICTTIIFRNIYTTNIPSSDMTKPAGIAGMNSTNTDKSIQEDSTITGGSRSNINGSIDNNNEDDDDDNDAYMKCIENDLLYYESNKNDLLNISSSTLTSTLSTIPETDDTKLKSNIKSNKNKSANSSILNDLPRCLMSEILIQCCRSNDITRMENILKILLQQPCNEHHTLLTIPEKPMKHGTANTSGNTGDDSDIDGDNIPITSNTTTTTTTTTTPINEPLVVTTSTNSSTLLLNEDDKTAVNDNIFDLDTILNYPESLDTLITPLHIASEFGYSDIVRLLLIYGANPERVDIRSRTPYYMAKDKQVKEIFRLIRGYHEEKWDWETAGVHTGVTYELLEEQEKKEKEKEREKKKRQKQKKKIEKEKNELDRIEKEKLRELQILEEEKLKNAMIAKMSAPCDSCGKTMLGIKALLFLDKKCCSPACSLQLRRKLSAEAALNRLRK